MGPNRNNMNNPMAAQGVQMLLGRFDANRSGALEGDELVAVAGAFHQLMMMARNGGQGMGGQGMGRGGFQFGQGPAGNMQGGQGGRGGGQFGGRGGAGGGGRGGGRR